MHLLFLLKQVDFAVFESHIFACFFCCHVTRVLIDRAEVQTNLKNATFTPNKNSFIRDFVHSIDNKFAVSSLL